MALWGARRFITQRLYQLLNRARIIPMRVKRCVTTEAAPIAGPMYRLRDWVRAFRGRRGKNQLFEVWIQCSGVTCRVSRAHEANARESRVDRFICAFGVERYFLSRRRKPPGEASKSR